MAIDPTPPRPGDRPWWAPLMAVLAVVPGLIALVFLVALRMITRGLRGTRGGMIRSILGFGSATRRPVAWRPGFLLASGVGGALGYRLGKRSRRLEYSAISVSSQGSDRLCRYPAAPADVPLHVGDDVTIWGRMHNDGILRGRGFTNASFAAEHRARVVASWVPVAAMISVVLCLTLAATVLSLTGRGVL